MTLPDGCGTQGLGGEGAEYLCVYVCVCVWLDVGMCVRAFMGEKERNTLCVCVYVCVCVRLWGRRSGIPKMKGVCVCMCVCVRV